MEEAHAIGVRIFPEVFSDIPVLYPRIRIDLQRPTVQSIVTVEDATY